MSPPTHGAPGRANGVGERHDTRRKTAVSTSHVLLLLVAFRTANALATSTFFQPDEYFQSLEPAWQLAFGNGSGAWITWDWRSKLRSSIHPGLFAAVYSVASAIAEACNLSLSMRAELLVNAPKIAQAVFAACLDYSTWRLAERVYGRGSHTAWTTLALTTCSPWQWFCSTRTLSNCLETALTAAALSTWPWRWTMFPTERDGLRAEQEQHPNNDAPSEVARPRLSLCLAALACILRPTNILIWICASIPALRRATATERRVLLRDAVLCGSAVSTISVLSDRLYYQTWTLPPLRFLYFNVVQSLAAFYGTNRRDYYLTEGLPLLLTTTLPFAAVGLWQALRASPNRHSRTASNSRISQSILRTFAWTVIVVILVLSVISHKEVRFIYPLLPLLHILSAAPLSTFFRPFPPRTATKKILLAALLALNLSLALYATQVHQRGVIDVLGFLRRQHERQLQQHLAPSLRNVSVSDTTVAFLMPCHSTPWRSHLVHPGIKAWALTCEPPLDVPAAARGAYMDEADVFYADPEGWLRRHMEGVSKVGGSGAHQDGGSVSGQGRGDGGEQGRAWPQYLVFFEQLEGAVGRVLAGSRFRECWRGFNSHWHDDWRRKGDVVVWCREDGPA